MKILVIYGPNLNLLGKRDPGHYGTRTLSDINDALARKASELKVELATLQSNSEGTLIDFIQEQTDGAAGIIINPGALTHYGLSLRDALADSDLPVIEVHLSNIHARERWRTKSVIAPIARGQIAGLGWRGFLAALDLLVQLLAEKD
ncbi:MAG: type II 3-dehydroquinate dehydratase [Chloroflexi bacterium]|nr:type II 3-dehydroquinate dehydratase [Chloroflexota bacterium]